MNLKQTMPENPTWSGASYAATHKASVTALLGGEAPRVSSRGSSFYNVDRWTSRVFTLAMCKWAAANAGCIPTRAEIFDWVREANQTVVNNREIVIAATPARVSLRTGHALTAGAYHEAAHTLYSCRRTLDVDEMATLVIPRWSLVPDWSSYYKLLQETANIAEDIRIERLLRNQFPGVEDKMHELQDFILHLEAKGLEGAGRQHGGKAPKRSSLSIVLATYRDIGLGYNTALQREALAGYRKQDAMAVDFVLNGPATDLLSANIVQRQDQDLACLQVALDLIGLLYKHSNQQDPANDENDKEHQPGGKHKQVCPDCNAPASKMVVRPKSDGHGGHVRGKGILTCSVCGFQQEVDLSPPKQGKPAPSKGGESPRFEGFDTEDEDQQDDGSEDGGEGDSGEGDEDGSGQGSASGDEDASDGDEGSQSGSGSGDEDGDDSGDAEGTDGQGQSGKGRQGTDQDGDTGSEQNPDGSKGTGGHHHDKGDAPAWDDLANDVLAAANQDTGLLDNNQALGQSVAEDTEREQAHEGGLKTGEQAWRPYDPSLDEVITVGPSSKGAQAQDATKAERLFASVRGEASFLRARLGRIMRAMEMTSVSHGWRKGRQLSERFLTDSKAALKAGQPPKRAYKQTDETIDTSFAAFVSVDESSSITKEQLQLFSQCMMAIVEPLDALGCPTMVAGWRDGQYGYGHGAYNPDASVAKEDRDGFHRYGGIVHDIFKGWHEPFRSVKWRFANTRSTGGTPMSDGIQFGLDALSYRNEAHRVLFVITDGCPNGDHVAVMQRQLRLAKETGIHVIGVGIGSGASYVSGTFPDHVYSATMSEMPALLIGKLNELVDMRAAGRGKRMPKAASR